MDEPTFEDVMNHPFNFDCEAYGPRGQELGASCWFGDSQGLHCMNEQICHHLMVKERVRVWNRINAMAAEGDEVGKFLQQAFPTPDYLLGGPHSDGPVTPQL